MPGSFSSAIRNFIFEFPYGSGPLSSGTATPTHTRATKAPKPDGQYAGPGSSPPQVFFPRLGEVLPFAVQRAPGIFY